MIIVSRLLLRFFSSAIILSLSLSFLFISPSKLSNSKFTTGRMTSRDVRPFASRYHFREKDRRKPLFVANRAAANEVRGGWGVVGKIWSRPREKWWKKNRWKFRGQKGRLCFAADCSFFLFFFFSPSSLSRNNFPFSRFRKLGSTRMFYASASTISCLRVSIWFSSCDE